MSAFPAIPFTYASRQESLQDRRIKRGTDGSPRIRTFWSGKFRLAVHFELLEAADRASIEAHFAANESISFDFDWDGTTYACIYGEHPFKWTPQPGDRWALDMDLEIE